MLTLTTKVGPVKGLDTACKVDDIVQFIAEVVVTLREIECDVASDESVAIIRRLVRRGDALL